MKADHHAAAEALLYARARGPIAALPSAARPATLEDAIAIQHLTMAALGPIGGWKVGAAGPDAPPSAAPLPVSGLHRSPATLQRAAFPAPEIESEIAFVMATDLPPRGASYTREEIVAAIASCHPGIEIVQSRFADPAAVDALSHLADLIRHGAYVLGAPIDGWRDVDFAALEVAQTIGAHTIHRRGNPAGDMIRLLAWLANEGAVWAGGPRAGDLVTCGSWTGCIPVGTAESVRTRFTGAEPVELSLAPAPVAHDS